MPEAPDAEQIDIFFAKSLETARQQGFLRPTIVIVPNHGNGNDFGNHFWASFCVVFGDEVILTKSYLLMFKGVPRTERLLLSRFDEQGDLVPFAGIAHEHVSLFPDIFYYRDLVKAVGYGAAVYTLRALGDGALLELEDPAGDRAKLLYTQNFHEGVLRQDGAWAAFRKGTRYLRRTPWGEELGIDSFVVQARLPSVNNPVVVDFDFTSAPIFDDRAAVLIGRNGAGKTQLLSKMVHAFTAPGRDGGAEIVLDPEPRIGRLLVFSSVASDLYPRWIPPWDDVDYEYFGIVPDKGGNGRAFLNALMDCRRSHGFNIENIGDRLDLLKQVIEPLGIWDAIYLPLKPHVQGNDLLHGLAIDVDGRRYLRYAQSYNEQRNLAVTWELDWEGEVLFISPEGTPRRLSSGELAMLRFAAQACAAIELDTLVLIDEPETHFHPNFVSLFMELLQTLLIKTSSVAIIATHSSYVVREVSRERVRVMSLAEDQISVGQPRMQTFGASVDAISQFVFGDHDRHHMFEKRLRQWLRTQSAYLTIEDILEKYGNQFNPESLSLIAQLVDERDAGH